MNENTFYSKHSANLPSFLSTRRTHHFRSFSASDFLFFLFDALVEFPYVGLALSHSELTQASDNSASEGFAEGSGLLIDFQLLIETFHAIILTKR